MYEERNPEILSAPLDTTKRVKTRTSNPN